MAPVRKVMLENDYVYHVFNKSIARFKIFNSKSDYERFMTAVLYYQKEKPLQKLSKHMRSERKYKKLHENNIKLVEIIAYCLMPTHIHFVLRQKQKNGITNFARNLLNSYSSYFNKKHKRKGPLWQGRFKSVLVEDEEQLYHLTRYIHLNPVTAHLIDKPEDWMFSSYKEFVNDTDIRICDFSDILKIEPKPYRKFVKNFISYQRDLAKIKVLIME